MGVGALGARVLGYSDMDVGMLGYGCWDVRVLECKDLCAGVLSVGVWVKSMRIRVWSIGIGGCQSMGMGAVHSGRRRCRGGR